MVSDTPKGIITRINHINLYLVPRDIIECLGRGVFASTAIAAKSIIEISPVLVLPFHDVDAVKHTLLNHYT